MLWDLIVKIAFSRQSFELVTFLERSTAFGLKGERREDFTDYKPERHCRYCLSGL
jgi:hypothetical protein